MKRKLGIERNSWLIIIHLIEGEFSFLLSGLHENSIRCLHLRGWLVESNIDFDFFKWQSILEGDTTFAIVTKNNKYCMCMQQSKYDMIFICMFNDMIEEW